MIKHKMRIARATNDLKRISKMYEAGLSLKKLGSFEDHQGFDGIMLGHESCDYHFEFTQERNVKAAISNSEENLIVFYVPDVEDYKKIAAQMIQAGFIKVTSHNPYWDQFGSTFQDFEAYRIVICNQA